MFVATNRLITALFCVLLLGAALFSVERVLFADASFILFRIINTGSLQVQEHRYGSFITQSVPLVAAYLHLPLKAIVVLYSISFTLFYLAVALLLLYRFKQQELAILMGFYFLLFVSDTFFWMNNEVHQGTAWMFLFFGFVISGRSDKRKWLLMLTLFTVLAFLALYTHPLLLFPTSYLWLFFTGRKAWPYSRYQTVAFSIILLMIALSRLYWSTSAVSFYDAEKLQNIRTISLSRLVEATRSPLARELPKQMVWNYWIVLVLFVAGMAAAWKQRAWWVITMTTGYIAVYLAALLITFNDFAPFYTESELMPATVILTTPFVYFFWPGVKPKTALILLALIFLTRLVYIGFASPKWIERKEWIFSTLDTMRRQQVTKGIIHENSALKDKLFQSWGTPLESIIASGLKGDKPQLTFVVGNAENMADRLLPGNATMIASFEVLHYRSLSQRYFRFDTTSTYRVLQVR